MWLRLGGGLAAGSRVWPDRRHDFLRPVPEDVVPKEAPLKQRNGGWIPHGRAVGPVPVQPILLSDVFGFRDEAEYLVGEADPPRANRPDAICRVDLKQQRCPFFPDGWSGSQWRSGSRHCTR
jgi:hypothetical protein